MAHQAPDRRRVLELLAKAAAVSQFPGFSKWASGAERTNPAAQYQPQFFNAHEFAVLDGLAELIIPRDEAPGAHEAGVAEFIDFMVFHDPDLKQPFREGLAQLEGLASMSPSEQEAAVRKLPRDFFLLARRWVVIGYYTSRVGLESLDYPGLRTYSTSPECPHKDDPEHTHLHHA